MSYNSIYSSLAFAIIFIGPIIHFLVLNLIYRIRNRKTKEIKRDTNTNVQVEKKDMAKQNEIIIGSHEKALDRTLKENDDKLIINKTGESDVSSPLAVLRLYSIYFHIFLVISTVYLIVVFTSLNNFSDTIQGLNILCYVSIPLSIVLIFWLKCLWQTYKFYF